MVFINIAVGSREAGLSGDFSVMALFSETGLLT